MKLISFAVISFLAITVSAYPGLGTPSQDLEEPQSTTTQSAQEPQSTTVHSEQEYQSTTAQDLSENSQQSLQDKLEKLIESYKAKQAEANELQNEIKELETEMSLMDSRANTLDGSEMMDLVQEFLAKNASWDIAYANKQTLKREMTAIMEECDEMIKKTPSLDETSKWLMEYNAKVSGAFS
ncbi:hypothetical protein BASA50_010281 [Batrachochytrium salamandrivorans]|uniref:Uncharacterized protein n=1 Tax=Batrachochytrium salamandrivorans TaxID=1357716 RepID=A0ABQ8F1X6_9FUNG|nr:hypothetical protein BASA50_010281 [Batrachochytrium salamandrivorans]